MTGRGLRVLLAGAASLALLAGGCGGEDDGPGPLDDSLGFLPQEAPFVVSIETDPRGRPARMAERVLDRFPFADRLREGLQRSVLGDADFEREVRPLLGNEFVVGAVDAQSFVDEDGKTPFVGAIQTADRARLERALDRSGAEARGERSGAKLYEDSDGDTFAVRDDVLVVASERGLLEDALARREAGDGLEQADFDEPTKGLGADALVRGYADVQALLHASPGSAGFRRIKWVNALRKLGLSAAAAGDTVVVRFRMATEPDGLSEEDLPIAPGAASPSIVERTGDVDGGIRDPAHLFAFLERAARAVTPGNFARYAAGKRALERSLAVDIERDLFGQLEGDLSIGVDLDGSFGARAAVKDPAAFRRTLEKLGRVVPGIAERLAGEPVDFAPPRGNRPFYALTTRGGEEILVYGLVNGVFVIATDAERAGRLPRESPVGIDGARGALVARADAGRLANVLVGALGPRARGGVAGRELSGPLDDATLAVSASTEGLEGKLSVTLERR
jgi:hypothetical protein